MTISPLLYFTLGASLQRDDARLALRSLSDEPGRELGRDPATELACERRPRTGDIEVQFLLADLFTCVFKYVFMFAFEKIFLIVHNYDCDDISLIIE